MQARRQELHVNYLNQALREHSHFFDEELFAECQSYTKRHMSSFNSLQSAKKRLNSSKDELRHIPMSQRVSYLFENPFATYPGRILLTIQCAFVALSIITFVMETVPTLSPQFSPSFERFYFVVEIILTTFFTLEALVWFSLTRDKIKWLKNISNIMLVIALIPFYAEWVIKSQHSPISTIRILRLARVIELLKNVNAVTHLVRALERSSKALLAPLVFLTIIVLVLSSVVYYAERGTFDPQRAQFMIRDCPCEAQAAYQLGKMDCPLVVSRFTSIPQTMWWGLVTMTTVGYGDLVPICPLGKIFGFFCILLGILFIAMPIAIIGSYFSVVITEHGKQRNRVKVLLASQLREDRRKVEDLGQKRQLHALETGEMRAFCAGWKLAHRGTREDMVAQIYEFLGHDATYDPGVSMRIITPGEALMEHLRTFIGDEIKLSNLDSAVVHHLDVFLYRLSSSLQQKWQQGTSVQIPFPSTNPCRLREATKNGKTIYLSRPLTLTIGRSTVGVPDPDIVLPLDQYEELRDFRTVSQRQAYLILECTPAGWAATLYPHRPSRISVNGNDVESNGHRLKQGDKINFCQDGSALEYYFECDDFDLSTVHHSVQEATACTPVASEVITQGSKRRVSINQSAPVSPRHGMKSQASSLRDKDKFMSSSYPLEQSLRSEGSSDEEIETQDELLDDTEEVVKYASTSTLNARRAMPAKNNNFLNQLVLRAKSERGAGGSDQAFSLSTHDV